MAPVSKRRHWDLNRDPPIVGLKLPTKNIGESHAEIQNNDEDIAYIS